MNFPTSIVVTDQEIDLSGLSLAQKEHFHEIKEKVVDLYQGAQKDRAIITFSGQSGVGKSVTAEILLQLLQGQELDFTVYKCGLDAFHYTNAELAEKHLHDVKGRFDTYNTDELFKVLMRFVNGHQVSFPVYSRKIHAPIQDGFIVSEQRALLLLEGLWFLRNDEEWQNFRDMSIYNFLITGDEKLTRENTISRHMRGGKSEEEAKFFYECSDYKNAVEVLNNQVDPDETILYYEEI